MRYLLDANVLMQARRLHYNPDYCPGFWEWLTQEHGHGRIFSIAAVLTEIRRGHDNLYELLPRDFFLRPPDEIGPALAEVSQWVERLPCNEARKNEFLSGADYHLVAQAKCSSYVVVTHEKSVPENQGGKIRIPNACAAVGATSVNLWDLLRERGARFILGA
ncbi:MAG: DUF4411 family protein [Terriglobales bacterium]